MLLELFRGDVARGLSHNGAQRSGIQFTMDGNDQCLHASVGPLSAQFHMTATLRKNGEVESLENSDHIGARKPTQLTRHRQAVRFLMSQGTVNLSFSLSVWTSHSGRKRPYAGHFCPGDHAFCREFRSS
jgi:hypothetical protein